MNWILDIVPVVLIVWMVVLGSRRGFFKSVMRLVSGVLALLIATWLATPIAEGIFSAAIEQPLTETLTTQLSETVEGGTQSIETALLTWYEDQSDTVRSLLSACGIDQSSLDIVTQVTDGFSADETVETAVQDVLRPAIVGILTLLATLILFLIANIALSFAVNLIDKVLDLPVLRQLNGTLGAVIGLLEGVLLACVLCSAVGLWARSADADSLVSQSNLEQTIIVQHLDFSEQLLDFDMQSLIESAE